jgi:DNA helicase-2/ATP-dependent DNA helicase PcrA
MPRQRLGMQGNGRNGRKQEHSYRHCIEFQQGILMNYTPSQLRAIQTVDRNLQIIACAGSGKTQVISRRIVEILAAHQQNGLMPSNIVAFTFTDRAAAELKTRIQKLCIDELRSDTGLPEMFVGTIHAYCLNLLQQPPVYKFLKYSVLNDIQQRLQIDRNSSKSGLTRVPLLRGGMLRRYVDSPLYQQVLAVLGEGTVDVKQIPHGVLEAVVSYRELCDAQKHLDYTTIISAAVAELANNSALRQKVAVQLKYLVVDEYQDVNPIQEELINRLHHLGANICVVGDDDQTVYQWRGSEVENIIHFAERYTGVVTERLNSNFRSSEGIVLAARQVIERNSDRLPKEMESTKAQPYERGDVLALEFPSIEEEAAWIAAKIRSLRGVTYRDKPVELERGLTWSDMAILLRSVRRDGEPVVKALEAANIPYVVSGMTGLFDTPEVGAVRDIFYYLASHNPKGGQAPSERDIRRKFSSTSWGVAPGDLDDAMCLLRDRKSRIGTRMDAELYLQRVYLDFLSVLRVREETVLPGSNRSGEVVFYNLGKFSQVISDFETIYFKSAPAQLYAAFASFLEFQAAAYYPEGWEEAGCIKPDAVQVMTVHQAKGMQWPAVFVPCLRRNRFPSSRKGGRSVWHVVPETAVANVDRYKGTVEDERRLFYVALTRAEKYLFCSWAPIPGNAQQRNASEFFRELTSSERVLTRQPMTVIRDRQEPQARQQQAPLTLTFSELKYYFDCPYLFKLRFLYGFDVPISRALGYGNSLHNALAEIHGESIRGRIPSISDIPRLVEEHLQLPFANEDVWENLRKAAAKALSNYLNSYGEHLANLEHVEKTVDLRLADGIAVAGRIDLIRRTDTGEVVIVDFKSDERAQAEDITRKQLHVYAVGYKQLTGKNADLIEVHNLDKGGAAREEVSERLIQVTLNSIAEAGKNVRENHLQRLKKGSQRCEHCDVSGLCRTA